MDSSFRLYRMFVGAVRLVAPILSNRSTKIARGLAGRRDADGHLMRWGVAHRDPARPCVWVHAPSVGETFQARAVIRALREIRPDLQVVFTHFSPSAEAVSGRVGADVAGYLPWDLHRPIRRCLEGVRPDILVFTKTEVWPVLTAEAVRRGTPVALVAATVPPDAGRLLPLARRYLATTWRSLSLATAIAEEDADRLRRLRVPSTAVVVCGDPGVDSAAARVDATDSSARYLKGFAETPRPTVVAGSTWPTGEALLLPALFSLREQVPHLRAIVAPHEPDTTGIRGLVQRFEEAGWRTATLSMIEAGQSASEVDAVIVDRVGVLAHLYTVASVAYVGGGFHDAGLHSVLEPAAAAVPVVFGPRFTNSRSAGELIERGAGRSARDADGLHQAMLDWLIDTDAHDYAAGQASGYIDAHRGAAGRTAAALDALLPNRSE